MARRLFAGILLAVIGAQLAAAPAAAQFGSIFGAPPRPPQDVPTGRPLPPPTEPMPPPPGRQVPIQQQQMPDSGIEAQPLPAPPGSAAAPAVPLRRQDEQPPAAPPAGQQQNVTQPPPENLQPGDEVAVEPPEHKIVNPTAVFSGLDKITGRITSFDVAIGETVQFGALQVTPRACYTRPPTETSRTDAFVEVDEVTLKGEIRRIFTGWMFASSPGLHAVEHPIYDVWLDDCKGGAIAEGEQPEEPAQSKPGRQNTPAPQRRTARPDR